MADGRRNQVIGIDLGTTLSVVSVMENAVDEAPGVGFGIGRKDW
jgi:molecular chaperone DnaK (HSP70)